MKRYISILLTAVMILLLSGCQFNQKREIETVVSKALQALQNAQKETVETYIAPFHDLIQIEAALGGLSEQEQIKLVYGRLDFDIMKISVKDTSATASVKITNTDMKAAFMDYLQRIIALSQENEKKPENDRLSEKELYQKIEHLLITCIEAQEKTVTTQVQMSLQKKDGRWKIILDDELKNVLSGGLRDAAILFDSALKS